MDTSKELGRRTSEAFNTLKKQGKETLFASLRDICPLSFVQNHHVLKDSFNLLIN